jgi:hypothetical protein
MRLVQRARSFCWRGVAPAGAREERATRLARSARRSPRSLNHDQRIRPAFRRRRPSTKPPTKTERVARPGRAAEPRLGALRHPPPRAAHHAVPVSASLARMCCGADACRRRRAPANTPTPLLCTHTHPQPHPLDPLPQAPQGLRPAPGGPAGDGSTGDQLSQRERAEAAAAAAAPPTPERRGTKNEREKRALERRASPP